MNFPVFDDWRVASLWCGTRMVTHGSMATFRITSLLWQVLELMMHRDDRGEKQATQHLQYLAGHQSGCDRGRARFGLTEISGFWAYTPYLGSMPSASALRESLALNQK